MRLSLSARDGDPPRDERDCQYALEDALKGEKIHPQRRSATVDWVYIPTESCGLRETSSQSVHLVSVPFSSS